jgi:hypothetical protein
MRPDAEYFSMEIDGVRLKVNKFFTVKGSFAEDSLLEALAEKNKKP